MQLSNNVRVGVSNVRVALQLLQPLDGRSTRAIAALALGAGASLLLHYCSRRWTVASREELASAQESVRDLQAQVCADRRGRDAEREAHVAEMQEVIAGHVEHLERVSSLVVAKEREVASLLRERDGITPVKQPPPGRAARDGLDVEALRGDLLAARAHSAKMEEMAQDAMRREEELLAKLAELEPMRGAAAREEEVSALLKQTLRREAELMERVGEAGGGGGATRDAGAELRVPSDREEGMRESMRELQQALEGALAGEAAARAELKALRASEGRGGAPPPLQDTTNAPRGVGKRGHERCNSFSSVGSSDGGGRQSSGVVESYLSRRTDNPRAHLQFSWA